MELFLAVTGAMGYTSDKEIATLAEAGPESVANWRSGAVKEFKVQKLNAAIDNLVAEIKLLRSSAGMLDGEDLGIESLEIESGSSPADLHKQFRDRVGYDYLGHRFMYFEPQGALAWGNLIRQGYDQERWLKGVADAASTWLDLTKGGDGQTQGVIAKECNLGRAKDKGRGLDIVALGPGEGAKEAKVVKSVVDTIRKSKIKPKWLSLMPVDVSVALVLAAARTGRMALEDPGEAPSHRTVLPVLADFEEGKCAFVNRLRTSKPNDAEGVRLVLLLGNVFGNVRDEAFFVRQKLKSIVRPGDLLWLEVGLRAKTPEDDPLYVLTNSERRETAAEANRRILLEGPYRRWAVATGRAVPKLELRVWAREDDESTRIPGSYNFCHDLEIAEERRVVTMLYSRRYDLEGLTAWLEKEGFDILGLKKTRDSKGTDRVCHILLKRQKS